MKKLSLKDCHELAKKKNGKFLSEEYVNSKTFYKWQCEKGHVWRAQYNYIQQGCWCIECAGLKRHTLKDCHDLAKSRNFLFLSKEYINSKTKYEWKCEKDHIWSSTYSDIRHGCGCPVCGLERRKKTNLKKYGSISPLGNSEIQAKSQKTWLRKYGVDNPSQVKEIALKASKSMNFSSVFRHWKTGEEIVCQGSYEKRVVEFFNKNKIEFKWQSKIFEMPNGKTYRPDCFLTEENKWVEIKGYFRKDAKEKWDWFHQKYPNSELWDKNKLSQLNIIE